MALRIGGQVIDSPAEEVLVLPRAKGQDIIITARAVLSMEEFDLRCPKPSPKRAWSKDKGNHDLVDDPQFKKDLETYGEKRFAFMAIKSLEPSEIEWEKTKLDDPNTWTGWTEELRDAGLSDIEVQRIVVCVMQANSLDESKLKQAREAFLHGLEEAPEQSSGPSTGQENTPSGQPVSDSE